MNVCHGEQNVRQFSATRKKFGQCLVSRKKRRYAAVMARVRPWGFAPQWGSGAKPLVKGPGGERSPHEAGIYFTMNVRVLHVY